MNSAASQPGEECVLLPLQARSTFSVATVPDPASHHLSSDGHGRDWLDGLAVARRALPRYANILDIPMGILEDDRWCPPWPHLFTNQYDFRFCVDGKAYVRHLKTSASYCFPDHKGLLRGRPRSGTDPTRLCPARRHARAGTSPLQHRGNPHAVSHHAPSAAVEGARGVTEQTNLPCSLKGKPQWSIP